MALKQNYFEIFGLQPSYEIDRTTLAERYRQLQREIHPDRFVAKSEREQLLAAQYAAQVNEANSTLRDPVKRAAYLLQLAGVEIQPEQTTADGEFLMQQMLLRERLEDVRTAAGPMQELAELSGEADQLFAAEQRCFADFYTARDLKRAENSLLKLQFLAKLQRQVEDLEEDLDL
jgi:molecular chaperone HscB